MPRMHVASRIFMERAAHLARLARVEQVLANASIPRQTPTVLSHLATHGLCEICSHRATFAYCCLRFRCWDPFDFVSSASVVHSAHFSLSGHAGRQLADAFPDR